MKTVCVVGSLSGVFTHSYIRGYMSLGYSVIVVNTSTKIHQDTYLDCPVFNTNPLKTNNKQDGIKARIKSSFLFCYLYELFLIFKSRTYTNNDLKSFISKYKIEHYMFFWGTSIRKEFGFIHKIEKSRKIKFFLDVATYPVRDYAKYNTPSIFLFFDKVYFNKFDTILSHSKVMDEYLVRRLLVDAFRIKRFICSFPSVSYNKRCKLFKNEKIKRVVFLGALDKSNKINDISSEIYSLAESGVQVYVQNNHGLNHCNIIEFPSFTFEEIVDGKLGLYCEGFDGVLVAYGKMSPLREKLTYPTRFALALLSSLPIFIQKARFDSLQEIISGDFFCNDVIFYEDIKEIIGYQCKEVKVNNNYKDCIESKLSSLLSQDII